LPIVADRAIRVVYTKYDGSLHWHHVLEYLGTDEHGIWLGGPEGTSTQRGDEPPISFRHATVQLFPAGTWWTAAFHAAPEDTEIYCDITTPSQWPEPDRVTMADLDLDVIRRRRDQRVVLLHEDEFAEHQVRYSYPADVIRRAEEAAAWLQQAISSRTEPFGAAYRAWLEKVS
jgi:uncharacterized protein